MTNNRFPRVWAPSRPWPSGQAGLLVAISIFFYVPVAFYYGWQVLAGVHMDFPSYYYAARLAFTEGKTPYGFNAFDAWSAAIGQKVNPYLYPPPSLLVFWPLASMTPATAQTAFLLLSHCCYLASIWLILGRITPLPFEERAREITLAASLVYLLCFDPAFATFGIGQVNVIALFFLCLTLAALRTGSSPWRAAVPLAMAILLKTYPALLLVPLLFRKKFRVVAFTCTLLGVVTAASLAVLPVGTWSSWFTQILPVGGYGHPEIAGGFPWNQSVNGFVMRLFLDSGLSDPLMPSRLLVKPVAWTLSLLIVGITVASSYARFRSQRHAGAMDEEMPVYLLMIFLIAPLSWDHHLVYILPAAVLVIGMIVQGSVSRRAAVGLGAMLFVIAWKIPLDRPAFRHGWWTLFISLKFYAVLVLWMFLIGRLYRLRFVAEEGTGSWTPKPIVVDSMHRRSQPESLHARMLENRHADHFSRNTLDRRAIRPVPAGANYEPTGEPMERSEAHPSHLQS